MNSKRGETKRCRISENIHLDGDFHYFYLERQRRYWRTCRVAAKCISIFVNTRYFLCNHLHQPAVVHTPAVHRLRSEKHLLLWKNSIHLEGFCLILFFPSLLFFPFLLFSVPLQKVWPAPNITFPLDWLCHRSTSERRFKGTSLWTPGEVAEGEDRKKKVGSRSGHRIVSLRAKSQSLKIITKEKVSVYKDSPRLTRSLAHTVTCVSKTDGSSRNQMDDNNKTNVQTSLSRCFIIKWRPEGETVRDEETLNSALLFN